MRRLLAISLLLGIGLLLIGCAGEQGLAERQIVAYAPSLLGPADRYRAHVSGISRSRIDRVRVIGHGVQLSPSLRIDELQLDLRDVRYQRGPFHVLGVGNTTFVARLSDRAINDLLRVQERDARGIVRDIRVMFQPNQVVVTAVANLLNQPITVSSVGQLQVLGDTSIGFLPQSISAGGVMVAADVQQTIAAGINPIIALSGLRFTPVIQRLRLGNGTLTVEGTAVLVNLP